MTIIQQNEATAAQRRIPFTMRSVGDGSAMTGEAASITVRITKTVGAASALGAGAVTEPDAANRPGYYVYEATAGEVDTLGLGEIAPVLAGAQDFAYPFTVVEYDPYAAPDAAADVATATRSELATELARIDAAVSTRATDSSIRTELTTELGRLDAAVSTRSTLTAGQVRTELTTELGRIDAAVSTRATPAQVATELATYDAPTRAELTSDVNALAATLTTIANYLDTEVAAILEDTGTTIPTQIAALNLLSIADVQTALTNQGLTTGVVALLALAAKLSGEDWTRTGDVITFADGTTMTLTETAGVVTGFAVATP